MAVEISFPLSSPQITAAEKVQSQLQNAGVNAQHLIAGDAAKDRQMRTEIVNETAESENPNVDEEGRQGQEYEASENKREPDSEPAPGEGESSTFHDDNDLQGRLINVVV
ncbi:MAG: hypothetical protein VCF07_16080 [Nitrospinota bacterium]